jgi:hypothetical protein
VPSGGTTSCSGPAASFSAVADADTWLVLRLRSTAIPPSQRITGPNGNANSVCLPIQWTFSRSTKATISV